MLGLSQSVKKRRDLEMGAVMSIFGRFLYGLLFVISIGFGVRTEAAGKKPSDNPSCGSPTSPVFGIPRPVRRVVLQPIGTKAFQLPNGATVNLTADLQSILNTAVASSSAFTPTDPGQVDPCDMHLEIRSAVTNFELEVANIGLSFGYTPSGSIPVLTNPGVNAKMNVRVGTIAMDFSIWSCVGTRCSAIGAANATHLTSGVSLGIDIDFGVIKTGPSFVYNTPMGDILRTIMNDGMKKLSSSNRVNELPWQASVKEFIPSVGALIFDAGRQDRLALNQAFEIYAPVDATSSGVCNVYEVVAYAHTLSVDSVSSTALIDRTLSSRGVRAGDVVMIHDVSSQ